MASSSTQPAKVPEDNDPLGDSASSAADDDEGWNDVEEDVEEDGDDDDGETQQVISLLDDRVFPDVMSMLVHCREKHGFDFLGVRQHLQLDFHGCVRLVNFIRQRAHEGLPVSEDISSSDLDHEQYLKPVLDDDAVIIGLFDLPELTPPDAQVGGGGGENEALVNDLLKRNSELQEELARVSAQYENYRATVSQTLDERWGDVAEPAESSKAGGAPEKEKAKGMGGEGNGEVKKEDDSKSYWESYAGVDIHETMLKDAVRTDAYRDFIYNNKHLFAGKTVLDIGCGTGILSMFCARAGASKVLAVDASAIIHKARENIYHNNLSSTITCLSGRIEEVTLPVPQVDIIVSEWMGYGLLFEAMLPSVLWARDRYLTPQGLMVPSHTSLWLAPVADPVWVADNGPDFWADVYGFDMRAMSAGIFDDARVLHWPTDKICGTAAAAFKMLDLYTTTAADLQFTAPFSVTLEQGKNEKNKDPVDGFLVWFDTFFSPQAPADRMQGVPLAADAKALEWCLGADGKKDQDRVAFTTGPWGTETHWKQALLLFGLDKEDKDKAAKKGDNDGKADAEDEEKKDEGAEVVEKKEEQGQQEIRGEITFSAPEGNARALDIWAVWNGRSQTWALR
ncbi:Uu.00g066510.m01.CDS01 [Anthostomella pinea]|uniref:type I protein arginine methyltransferase n=1 Tax=Anthostomella pinea TaxID=933095 RepID=A0AAI8VTZ3_9PEZI|nr:Uu.00g066510.m01.CDS01 [Anthostomella pinea]